MRRYWLKHGRRKLDVYLGLAEVHCCCGLAILSSLPYSDGSHPDEFGWYYTGGRAENWSEQAYFDSFSQSLLSALGLEKWKRRSIMAFLSDIQIELGVGTFLEELGFTPFGDEQIQNPNYGNDPRISAYILNGRDI